jgi:hypothetical protein
VYLKNVLKHEAEKRHVKKMRLFNKMKNIVIALAKKKEETEMDRMDRMNIYQIYKKNLKFLKSELIYVYSSFIFLYFIVLFINRYNKLYIIYILFHVLYFRSVFLLTLIKYFK